VTEPSWLVDARRASRAGGAWADGPFRSSSRQTGRSASAGGLWAGITLAAATNRRSYPIRVEQRRANRD
jgi:hypothetical protein